MKLVVVCVLYNPPKEVLEKWMKKICCMPQIFFVLVDNSKLDTEHFLNVDNVSYIPCHKNLGVAAAQNIGIKYAKQHGFDNIVFFDQDSDFSEQYLSEMAQEYSRIKNLCPNLAILGPKIINKDTNQEYKHGCVTNNEGFVICREIISSGTFVETDLFDKIGLMEEPLFIDYVDFEWCWRAKQKGYLSAKTQNVFLLHKVGQENHSFVGYPVILSTPIRYYYQYRNFFRLVKRSYVPFKWKQKVFVRKMVEFLVVPFIYQRNIKTLYYMIKGLFAGLLTK